MNAKNYGSSSRVLVAGFDLASVGHRSYMIVDAASRTAVVIDPPPDPAACLAFADREGALIRHVFLTQLHSDFECGHRSLLARTGAVVYTGAWARPEFAHLPVKDGDALQFGATSLRVLETPGHTLEGISIVAAGAQAPERPWGLFSGDLVFDGDVARPEPRLDDGFAVDSMADMLYASIFRKLLALPPDIRVFTGHGAADGEPPTLAGLRAGNPLMQSMSRSAFRSLATAGMLPAPLLRQTRNLLNRSAAAGMEPRPADLLPRLPLYAFLAKIEAGAIPLDLREPREFAVAHLRGALSLGLGADFADWAPALLDATEEYLVITNPGAEAEAAQRLAPLVGPRLRGVLDGGMISLESRPDLLEASVRRFVSPSRRAAVAARVDVRPAHDADEDARDRVRRLPLEELLGRLGEMPGRRSALAVVDGDPYRAHAAASLLRRRGWPGAHPLLVRAGRRSPA